MTGHEHGGYDMDDSEIGIVLMSAAIFQLLFQVNSEINDVLASVCMVSWV